MINGSGGITTGLSLFAAIWLLAFLRIRGTSFDLDPQREKAAFEKILGLYLDLSKFVLGLASGSIVLLVGSFAFRSSQRSPDTFASPLFLMVLSVLYGVSFMTCLILNYEQYRAQGGASSYTKFKYTRNLALGFSAISCFCAGYIWLVFIVTA